MNKYLEFTLGVIGVAGFVSVGLMIMILTHASEVPQ